MCVRNPCKSTELSLNNTAYSHLYGIWRLTKTMWRGNTRTYPWNSRTHLRWTALVPRPGWKHWSFCHTPLWIGSWVCSPGQWGSVPGTRGWRQQSPARHTATKTGTQSTGTQQTSLHCISDRGNYFSLGCPWFWHRLFWMVINVSEKSAASILGAEVWPLHCRWRQQVSLFGWTATMLHYHHHYNHHNHHLLSAGYLYLYSWYKLCP